MAQKGLYVRLHTDNEWNGLYGMICAVTDSEIAVFCVTKPLYKYYVQRDGSESGVLEFVSL